MKSVDTMKPTIPAADAASAQMRNGKWQRNLARLLTGAALSAACAGALAQAYPAKPVQIIVPFSAGGSLDSLVRTVAQQLGKRWNVPVVVENRDGASGIIGLNVAAKAPADGYTLVAVSNSFAANTLLRTDMPYDAFKDFEPITLLGSVPFVLTVNAALPVNTMQELVAYAKQHPLAYSSGGAGTMSHLGGEMLKRATGIDATHIPYRGQAPALTDVVTGQVAFTLGNLPEVIPYVKAGKVKALATLTAKRSTLSSQIPTLVETGYKNVEAGSWYGLVAPAHTPADIVLKLQREIAAVLKQPEISERLAGQGFDTVGNTPEAFKTFLRTETAAYKKVIEEAGIKVD